jgi:hypothetical protein
VGTDERSCLDAAGRSHSLKSPFDRLLAVEVYDGPTAGIVFCRDGKGALVFRLLAWDERQDLRAFALAPLAMSVAVELIALVSRLEPERWPEWWLKAPGVDSAVTHQIDEMLARSSEPEFLVITSSLLGTLEYCRGFGKGPEQEEFSMLARRDNERDEVSITPFAMWVDLAARGQLGSKGSI